MSSDVRVAFLSPEDAADLMAWSGTHHFIAKALREQGAAVEIVQVPGGAMRDFGVLYRRISNRVRPGSALPHTLGAARRYARDIMRSSTMRRGDFDVVVASAASPMVAALPEGFPVLHVSDATFHAMLQYYEGFSGLTARAVRQGDALEAAVLRRADVAVLASEWAARSAIDDYGTSAAKVMVAPFGPNLTSIPSILDRDEGSRSGRLRILFVGRRWIEKGGDTAVRATELLRNSGVDARLTVCGTVPPSDWQRDWIDVVPALDKNAPEGEQRLTELYRSHDVLILPSRAECYGLVLCEAAAFGLPAVASRTGGIPTVVADGESGALVAPSEGAEGFAARLMMLAESPVERERLGQGARERYQRILNWQAWGDSMMREIHRILG